MLVTFSLFICSKSRRDHMISNWNASNLPVHWGKHESELLKMELLGYAATGNIFYSLLCLPDPLDLHRMYCTDSDSERFLRTWWKPACDKKRYSLQRCSMPSILRHQALFKINAQNCAFCIKAMGFLICQVFNMLSKCIHSPFCISGKA